MHKLEELRKLSVKELAEELEKSRKDVYKVSLALKMGTEKASHKLFQAKQQVARIKTIQKERTIEEKDALKGQEKIEKPDKEK